MKHLGFLILVVLPAVACAEPSVTLERCILDGPRDIQHVEARCGTLTVPENPARPDGHQIELFFAVIPAASSNPAPDPVVLLAGGPGQAATEVFVPLIPALEELNEKRALILLDQRGTGRSHPLDCPRQLKDLLATEFSEATVKKRTRRCLASLEHADPRFYTTPIAMDDLERLREALGYEKLNLIGVSYGTRAAQVYLRRHPEHVRTMVLAGVVPMQAALGLDHAKWLDRALKRLFERCSETPVCARAFPHPWESLQDLLRRVADKPVPVTLTHPRTAKRMTFPVTRTTVAGAVRLLSYAPAFQALIPLLVHDAWANGNLDRLAAQALMVGGALMQSISHGMELSVLCAEDVPFYPDDWQPPAHSVLGGALVQSARWACEVWPQGEVPAGYHEPVESDKPILLLAGENDPVTPPPYARAAMVGFSNAQLIVVPGQGHAVLSKGCIPELVTEFVADAGFADLDTACVKRMGPFPFFTSFAGPAP